jgi:hypothetical protein
MGVVLARCGVGCAVGATIFYLEEDQTWYQSTIIGGALLLPAICHVNPQQTVLLQRGASAVLLFFLDKLSSFLHLF